jgi:hypothetical protein
MRHIVGSARVAKLRLLGVCNSELPLQVVRVWLTAGLSSPLVVVISRCSRGNYGRAHRPYLVLHRTRAFTFFINRDQMSHKKTGFLALSVA